MSLARAHPGARLRVTRIHSGSPLTYRLMEMGVVEGAEIQFLRRAPLGDPLHVRIGDYELSLRATDAELIEVTAI